MRTPLFCRRGALIASSWARSCLSNLGGLPECICSLYPESCHCWRLHWRMSEPAVAVAGMLWVVLGRGGGDGKLPWQLCLWVIFTDIKGAERNTGRSLAHQHCPLSFFSSFRLAKERIRVIVMKWLRFTDYKIKGNNQNLDLLLSK